MLLRLQIINMAETGHWETDWIVIGSEKTTGLFTFGHALKTFTRDEVGVTRFRLYQDQYPDKKRLSGIQKLCQNINSKYATCYL